MKNYKIVFIDIDGTLFNDQKQVSKTTVEVIKKLIDDNIKVVLCSGRCSYQVKDISEEIKASEYIICSNGAEVYNYKKKEVIFQSIMDPYITQRAVEYCNKHSLNIYLNGEYIRYTNNKNVISKDNLVVDINNIPDKIFQIVITGDNYNRMLSLKGLFSELYPDINNVNSSYGLVNKIPNPRKYYYRDFLNNNISKSKGIVELLDHLNLKAEDAISIGDGYNDISMFELTDLSVAMANSDDYIRSIARKVTLSNNEDGVAIALKEIFNIK